MGFLGVFDMRVFGWLICLYVVSGVACDVVDFGWLKLSLFIDVLGVLVWDDSGVIGVGVEGIWRGLRGVWWCVFRSGERVN